jgi:ABC-2 type transport system permease protein
MNRLRAELRLILRSRLGVVSLALLLLLASLAVCAGIAQVGRQEATIARVAAEQQRDIAAVAAVQGKPDGDPGYAAYYSFLLTHDAPPPLAFAAIGQRDVQPFVLRVRALGLQQQLYDAEAINAELALPGVFDWAFVLVYLAPLIVIALTHDLVTGEREGGRLRLLLSMPGRGLWRRRVALRYALVLAAVALPFVVGAMFTLAPAWPAAAMLLVAALYLAFWFGVALLLGSLVHASATAAASLIGCWVLLTLVLPTLANAAIARTIPTAKGIDLTLAQREIVHHGWDVPKAETFERFFVHHPEWRGRERFEGRFHWKWYLAMHQVGDEAVSADVSAYRASLIARERWSARAGYLLPGVATQGVLHRIADTDQFGQFAYQDSIAVFHERLRRFFYPYLFADRPFTRADFARMPAYAARAPTGSIPVTSLLALLAAAGLLLGIGGRRMARISGAGRA